MNGNSSSSDSCKSSCNCSIFWPLWIVFFMMLIAYVLQVRALAEQSKNLDTRLAQLQKMAPQAQMVNTTLAKMSRSLLDLVPTNEEARKIVAEFRIQSNPAGPDAGPATVGASK